MCSLLFVSRAVALEKGGGLQDGPNSVLTRTYVGVSLQIRYHVLTPVLAVCAPNFVRQALPRMGPILRELVRVIQDLDIPESPFRPWRDLRWVLAKMCVHLILPLRFRFVPYLEAACHDVNGKAREHTIGIAYQSEPNILDAHPTQRIFDHVVLITVQRA
jgi:hypothetical protein